jgi:hypothetical protein
LGFILALGGLAALLYLAVTVDPNILCLMPAAVLAIVLLTRRYPGEHVLLALAAGRRKRWPRPRSCLALRRAPMAVLLRGSDLMGCSLAVRPPPASLPAS